MHNSGDITNLAKEVFGQLMLPKPQIRSYVLHKLHVTKDNKNTSCRGQNFSLRFAGFLKDYNIM